MFARAFIARFGLVALLLCLGAAGMPALAFEIAPHRAVYDLSLAGSKGNSQVVDVTGAMEFDWEDACDGWSVTQRTAMAFSYQSGQTVQSRLEPRDLGIQGRAALPLLHPQPRKRAR